MKKFPREHAFFLNLFVLFRESIFSSIFNIALVFKILQKGFKYYIIFLNNALVFQIWNGNILSTSDLWLKKNQACPINKHVFSVFPCLIWKTSAIFDNKSNIFKTRAIFETVVQYLKTSAS